MTAIKPPFDYHDRHLPWDTLHSFLATLGACLLSGGLIYGLYLARILTTAVASHETPTSGACLLVFGKRLVAGAPDADFLVRIQSASRLLSADPKAHAILLGGGPPGATEADVARAELLKLNPNLSGRLRLEARSENTLENMRNAREILRELGGSARVVLVSNRYHLARCGQFARQLGFEFELHPAEARFRCNAHNLLALLREAFCLAWLDIGTRWARLIGHERMIRRVT